MTKIIGVDEVGRGAIAGPLAVAACTVHNRRAFNKLPLKDSKQMTHRERERVFDLIMNEAKSGRVSYALSYITAQTIDKKGMAYSLKTAVARTLAKLNTDAEDNIILDGSLYAPLRYERAVTETKADERFLEVALASVIAKVSRDRKMEHLSKQIPHYGFESHVGYGTKMHRTTIQERGMSPEHRKTFCSKIVDF